MKPWPAQPTYRPGITFREYLRYELRHSEWDGLRDVPDTLVEEMYARQHEQFLSWVRYSISKARHNRLMVELGFNPRHQPSKY